MLNTNTKNPYSVRMRENVGKMRTITTPNKYTFYSVCGTVPENTSKDFH